MALKRLVREVKTTVTYLYDDQYPDDALFANLLKLATTDDFVHEATEGDKFSDYKWEEICDWEEDVEKPENTEQTPQQ